MNGINVCAASASNVSIAEREALNLGLIAFKLNGRLVDSQEEQDDALHRF